MTDALVEQLDLLAEHRQALITAAFTGEFAVPGAASPAHPPHAPAGAPATDC